MTRFPFLRLPGHALGPGFRRLVLSDALMLVALMAGHVVAPWWVVEQGGAADLAVYGSALSALSFLAMPLLSPLGDRVAKGRVITVALAAFALAALGLAVLASAGRYHLGVLIALEAVPVLAMAAILPATQTLAAELVPAAELPRAIAAQQSAQSLGRLVGPALGGAWLATLGVAGALWGHAVLLLAAVALAARLPRQGPAAGAPRAWWAELRAGLRATWAIPLERWWTLVNALSWVFLFPAFTLLVPVKVQSLGLSGLWLGLSEAGLSMGMLAGGLGLAARWIAWQGRHASRVSAACLQGLALASAGLATQGWQLVLAFTLAGLCTAVMMLVGMTHRVLARPPAFRARMSASGLMCSQVAATLGPALAGLALLHAPVAQVYLGFGLAGALLSLGLLAVPGFKTFLALSPQAIEGWYGRQHPQAFEPPAR